MAAPIVIESRLSPTDIAQSSKQLVAPIKSALTEITADAKRAAAEVKSALGDAFKQSAAIAQQVQAARQQKEQAAEAAHQRKLTEIAERELAARRTAEAKAQAQIDVAREKAALAEEARQRRLAQGGTGLLGFFKKFSSTIREAGESIQQAGVALTGFSALLIRVGSSSIQASGSIESIQRGLKNLDGIKADATFQRLRQQADSATISFTQYANAVIRVRATQKLTSDESERLVKGLINIGRQSGVSAELQNRAIVALNQILSKGKVTSEELKQQLLEAIPDLTPIIEKRFGTLDAEKLEKRFGSKKFVQGLIEELSKIKQVDPTALERFQIGIENLQIKLAPLGNRILDLINRNLTPFIDVVEKLVQRFESLPIPLQETIVQIGFFAVALGPAVIALGSFIQTVGALGNLVTVFTSITAAAGPAGTTGAMTGLAAAMGTTAFAATGLAAVLVGAGVAAFFIYRQEVAKLDLQLQRLKDKADGVVTFFGKNGEAIRVGPNQAFDPQTKQVIDIDPNAGKNLRSGTTVDLKTGEVLTPEQAAAKKLGSDSVSKAQEAAAKQARQRSFTLLKEGAEERIRELERTAQRELDLQKETYDLGLLGTKEYFDNRIALQRDITQKEIAVLQEEASTIENNLKTSRLSTQEKTAREKELLEVRGRILDKTNALTAAEQKNAAEFIAASKLPAFDPEASPSVRLNEQRVQSGLFQGLPEAPNELFRRARDARQRAADVALEAEIPLIQLRTKELEIQNKVNEGLLTEAEARQEILAVQRQQRDLQIAILEERKKTADLRLAAEIDEEIARLRSIGVELNNAQSFMRGFGKETETVGDIFERFGQNVSNAFKNTKGLLDNLKNAVKQFFADLLGNALQNTVRQLLGTLFGGGGSGATRGGGGSVGGGGLLGGLVGAITGNPAIGRSGGTISTPPFNPNAGSGVGGVLGGILGGGGGGGGGILDLGAIFRAGGGIVPPSLTTVGPTPGFSVRPPGVSNNGTFGILGSLGNVFSSLTRGIGFGLPAGSARGGLASALPLLGLSLGSGLGGGSSFGQLLGGIGGGLLGVGLTAAPAGLAGSALGFLAPLFSNPITAAIGAALLPAAFLFGRARQRRRDEATSGDSLQRAIDSIFSLQRDIAADRFDGAEARDIFENEILAQFIAEINQIRTRSVRESRLTNQVRDLRNLFEQVVAPTVTAQAGRISQRRAADELFGKLVPEFATGGIVPGRDLGFDSVMALLRPGEMVLTRGQQSMIKAMAGGDVFSKANVPDSGEQSGDAQAFAGGGIAARISGGRGGLQSAVVIDNLVIGFAVGQRGAEEVVIAGGNSPRGRQVTVNNIKSARTNREL